MNAEQYRAAIAALGLSQQASARLLGVDGRTVQRWALGERDVAPPAARFLRYLIRVGADPARVQAMLDQDEPAADATLHDGSEAKRVTPSAELAAIVGADPLPRTAVVSKVWDHIRAHSLQDPADQRTIVADDKLRAVFGKERATIFELNKLLSANCTSAA